MRNNKTVFIVRYEILTALSRKLFVAFSFGLPLLVALTFLGISVVNSLPPGDPVESAPLLNSLETEAERDS